MGRGIGRSQTCNPGHPASPAPGSGMFAGLALLVPPKAVVPPAARNYCAHPPSRPKRDRPNRAGSASALIYLKLQCQVVECPLRSWYVSRVEYGECSCVP